MKSHLVFFPSVEGHTNIDGKSNRAINGFHLHRKFSPKKILFLSVVAELWWLGLGWQLWMWCKAFWQWDQHQSTKAHQIVQTWLDADAGQARSASNSSHNQSWAQAESIIKSSSQQTKNPNSLLPTQCWWLSHCAFGATKLPLLTIHHSHLPFSRQKKRHHNFHFINYEEAPQISAQSVHFPSTVAQASPSTINLKGTCTFFLLKNELLWPALLFCVALSSCWSCSSVAITFLSPHQLAPLFQNLTSPPPFDDHS